MWSGIPPTFPASPRWARIRSVPGSTSMPWPGSSAASSQQIKGVLRSQSVIAGIGNAYSDEILHAARISPFAMARSLDREAVQRLYDAIHSILGTALREASGQAAQRTQGHQAEPHEGPRPGR